MNADMSVFNHFVCISFDFWRKLCSSHFYALMILINVP